MPDINETTLQLTAPDHQLRVLAEAIPQMVWTSDACGMWQYVNNRWYEYTGLNYDQTRNLQWTMAVHADDVENTEETWQRAIETGKVYEIAHRIKRGSDGTFRWHLSRAMPLKNASGDVTNWFGTSTDIEEQRQTIDQMKLLAESIPQLVWTCNPNGECDYMNEKWTEYTGVPARKLQVIWLEQLHPDDRESTKKAWQSAVDERDVYDIDYRIRGKDSQYRWFRTRGLPIRDSEGKIIKWFGTCTDVNDQRKAAELLEQRVQERTEALEIARDEAVRASILKSQFVQNISHEIRTPMSGVLGMSELLSEMEMPDEAKEMSRHIFIAANTLMGIVNDLLDFSKLDANKVPLQMNKFSLAELLKYGSLSISSALTKKKLALVIDVEKTLPDCFFGDEKKIRQILVNLLSNAVKFTECGDIKLSISEQARSGDWLSVRFTVTDPGIGISEEILPKLFEPFVQADGTITRRFGGTGLGLSICRKLVTLMKGEIGVESKAGSGSTFWFMIPLEVSE